MGSKNPHYEPNELIEWTDQTKELRIKPRDLNIVWGDDKRYWRMPDPDQGDSPAELLQVNWLEVTGSVKLNPGELLKEILNPEGRRYEIGFTVSLSADAFGWTNIPVYIMAKIGKKGQYTRKKVSVVNIAGNDKFDLKVQISSSPNDQNTDTFYFGLYEVWSGRWKGGLKIYSAFIREVKEASGAS